jgi:CheY-like chemotaxis protein
MNRVVLIHWNAAEAEERAQRLREAGFEPEPWAPRGAPDVQALQDKPPDAFVIDLGRLPSQGRDAAIFLRQRKATRGVPIVFVEGDPEKTARVQRLLPDATYTEWHRVGSALRQAMAHPPADPVVPGTMDSYAGKPLPEKLGIRRRSTVVLLGAPAGFEAKLTPLPEGARLRRRLRGLTDLVVLFARAHSDLERRFSAAGPALAEAGGLWIAWPKKSSGVVSDLDQTTVRAFGLDAGLVDYKICAIDRTWSGLLFTRRRDG